jgi:prolyl-tRNA synthetase
MTSSAIEMSAHPVSRTTGTGPGRWPDSRGPRAGASAGSPRVSSWRMRVSKLFGRTLREAPAEAEVASQQLLLRAAFMRQVMAGVYVMLPLGQRTMSRIERIVREEMEVCGAQEIRMPIVLPAEPWRATGRWDLYGELLFRLKDRHGRDLLLGPTEEEAITPLVAAELASYRDLPVNLYQVEWKYRDEFRPRYGLLRGREFLMKDAYSFDRDEAGLRRSYRVMYEAYERIFDRCGLDYVVVEADPGQIGGGVNHEFMARSEVGEDLLVECEHGDYLADTEAARSRPPDPPEGVRLEPLEEVLTPGAETIDAVTRLLGVRPEQTLKCLLCVAEPPGGGAEIVAVLVPGDRELSQDKLAKRYFPARIRLFEDADFERSGYVRGYVGPQVFDGEHPATVLADHLVRGGANWVTGANKPEAHVRGANVDRDFRVDAYDDLVLFREGDPCPVDGGKLRVSRSIVVGHIYQLGTKYSKPLRATFIDEDGTPRHYEMGCYGIGISRIMAAVAEQYHDGAGLTWPKALAPFEVVVVPTNMDHPEVVAAAEGICARLRDEGLDVLIDDRDERAGVKLNDADLIGIPVQLVVGARGVDQGLVDWKRRDTGERGQGTVEPGPLSPLVRQLLQEAQ